MLPPDALKPDNWYIFVVCSNCKERLFLFADLTDGKGSARGEYNVTCSSCDSQGLYPGERYHHKSESDNSPSQSEANSPAHERLAPPEHHQAISKEVSKAGKGKAVLCVEDDQDTFDLLGVMLSDAGYDVLQARNVTDGFAIAKRERLDLILLDWHFPDGTGIELCRAIREFDPVTPIFFYTGNDEQVGLLEAMRAGAHGYFTKPVDHDSLLRTLANYAGRERLSRPS